ARERTTPETDGKREPKDRERVGKHRRVRRAPPSGRADDDHMQVHELLARPFAHRGLHSDGCPENSLPAFDAAIHAGFGIELDVRLSADGAPVVFHDADLGRLCGVDARVSQLPVRELCRTRVAGSTDTIPTL